MTRPAATSPAGTAPLVSEKAFAATVCHLAKVMGWTVFHPYLSIRSEPGWPDLFLCRPPRIVLAELKRESGKTTPDQERWLGLLGACPGVETFCWKPSDWPVIMEVLSR